MDNVAETARKALEILDRDGWCKGSTAWSTVMITAGKNQEPRMGSHCLGGAWNFAIHGKARFIAERPEFYRPLADVICAQYPEIAEIGFTDPIGTISNFNDRTLITESDVRAILEKLAVREEI